MANERLVYQKRIRIPFVGLIGILGCSGPVEVPFYLPVERIGEIVACRYPVIEVLKDGSEVKLDISNYDKENGGPGNESIIVSSTRPNRKKINDSKVLDVADNVSEADRMKNLLLRSTKKPNPKFTEEKVVDRVPAEKIEVHKDKKKFHGEKFEKK